MGIELPHIIQDFVDSSNRHDVQSILSCFSDDAVVRDEGGTLRGQNAIKRLDYENNREIQIPVQSGAAFVRPSDLN